MDHSPPVLGKRTGSELESSAKLVESALEVHTMKHLETVMMCLKECTILPVEMQRWILYHYLAEEHINDCDTRVTKRLPQGVTLGFDSRIHPCPSYEFVTGGWRKYLTIEFSRRELFDFRGPGNLMAVTLSATKAAADLPRNCVGKVTFTLCESKKRDGDYYVQCDDGIAISLRDVNHAIEMYLPLMRFLYARMRFGRYCKTNDLPFVVPIRFDVEPEKLV